MMRTITTKILENLDSTKYIELILTAFMQVEVMTAANVGKQHRWFKDHWQWRLEKTNGINVVPTSRLMASFGGLFLQVLP